MSWCREQGFTPGITEVLHTFGSVLDFHPHIHMLLSEGGIGEDDNFDFAVWKECCFFPERVLKERFKYFLIKSLRGFAAQKVKEKAFNIPNELKELWQRKLKCRDFYTTTKMLCKIIWYVHIGEKLHNANFTTRYIGRYAKRPCLSETKILYYNFEEQVVKFSYHDKITNTEQLLTLSVEEFLGRLIRHIPEKNFRMIRYYGIYANAVRNKLIPILIPQIAALYTMAELTYEPKKTWRELITASTGIDPLVCPNCNVQMDLVSITYRTRDGPLKTVYLF
jgi:hypothetical protein